MSAGLKSKSKVQARSDKTRIKRASVTIPHITESNSTRRLREKNKKIVSSVKNYNKEMFDFD